MVRVPMENADLTEDEMKGNSEHQKNANATDQKTRTDDEHLHEIDKRHLKESEKAEGFIPEPDKQFRPPDKD